ncbi:tyrosine-type recombinase/integrase [Algoriphagus boritolerans]|uniref:tyrosine-type recombinase/integrase n=1 Tax=Algoriphagus boritolerans TaxID=308111 RepID=UPI003A101AFD
MLIGLLYGCGLRCFEVRNLKIADLDFDRKVLHVKDGKGKKRPLRSACRYPDPWTESLSGSRAAERMGVQQCRPGD